MVEIDVQYVGNHRCELRHKEGMTLTTDAPKDIGGNATAFSPTDLVAAGLASCILTTMAMYAERHNLTLAGVKAYVVKEMGGTPRKIARLPVVVTLSASIPLEMRERLEKVAHTCPVHASLHPDIDAPIEFRYE